MISAKSRKSSEETEQRYEKPPDLLVDSEVGWKKLELSCNESCDVGTPECP
jgi:hypothetical protein